MNTNKIHIYCGDGKGKTTACVGLAIRAVGANYNVIFVQFLKGMNTAEINILQNIPEIKIVKGDLTTKFTFQMNKQELEHTKLSHEKMLKTAIGLIDDDSKNMLILDEVLGAINTNTLEKQSVLNIIKNINAEVVLSGRQPAKEFVEIADYISEINKIKHPYDLGFDARKGIEY